MSSNGRPSLPGRPTTHMMNETICPCTTEGTILIACGSKTFFIPTCQCIPMNIENNT